MESSKSSYITDTDADTCRDLILLAVSSRAIISNCSSDYVTSIFRTLFDLIVLWWCLFKWDTKVLPEPISTQCIMTDGDRFHFSCFQLNTLNFETSDGVKNLVWFDEEERPLFNRVVPKRAMLRNTRYLDYDADVFRQIVAFYVNGLRLSDSNRVEMSTVRQA